ncbi:hypothetical protein [Pantoea agglomerans]|uniref:hypothetical protein n=1 Tax=Enterobacter agglomerans TaxID=549 RepID=UPI0034CE5D8E
MIINSVDALNKDYKNLICDYLAHKYKSENVFIYLKENKINVLADLKGFCYEVRFDYDDFLNAIKENLLCSIINIHITSLAKEIKTCVSNRNSLTNVFNLLDDATLSRAITFLKNKNKKLLSHSFRIEKNKVLLSTFMNCNVEFYFREGNVIPVLFVDDKRFVCKSERNAVKLCYTNAIEKIGNV